MLNLYPWVCIFCIKMSHSQERVTLPSTSDWAWLCMRSQRESFSALVTRSLLLATLGPLMSTGFPKSDEFGDGAGWGGGAYLSISRWLLSVQPGWPDIRKLASCLTKTASPSGKGRNDKETGRLKVWRSRSKGMQALWVLPLPWIMTGWWNSTESECQQIESLFLTLQTSSQRVDPDQKWILIRLHTF